MISKIITKIERGKFKDEKEQKLNNWLFYY